MKIYIASDHGGFELKNKIKEINLEFEIEDLGPSKLNPDDDYVFFAEKLCKEVLNNNNSLGILICRSGIGMSIAANKFKGIYAALCFNEKHAQMARQHNNANVLCLDSDYGDFETHKSIINSFLNSQFEGKDTRHGRRVDQIREIEENNFKL